MKRSAGKGRLSECASGAHAFWKKGLIPGSYGVTPILARMAGIPTMPDGGTRMGKKKSLKIHYEAQLSCPEGLWGMTMTITRGDTTWTSPWFAFQRMERQNFLEARKKAAEQFIALHRVLEPDAEEPFSIDQWGVYGSKRTRILPEEGAWKCLKNNHWFAYEPPPSWPPSAGRRAR